MNRIEIVMNDMKYSGWLIDSLETLEQYRDMSNQSFKQGVKSLIKSNQHPSGWDHMVTRSDFGGILACAIESAHTKSNSPLLELANVYDGKMMTMALLITNGSKLILNDVGGYCIVSHDDYVVIDKYEKVKTYSVKVDTKYINIENDPQLEEYTKLNLPKFDKNYSHITNAIQLTRSEVKEILIEFKSNGGIGIWQYTTGMNIDQLYMFIDVGIEVGLYAFAINFNGTKTHAINELIKKYESQPRIVFFHQFVV